MRIYWDSIRELLLDIKQGKELFSSIPLEPQRNGQSETSFTVSLKHYKLIRGRIFGHLKLLVDAGYVDGISIEKTSEGYAYRGETPKLTPSGKNFFKLISSKTMWGKINRTAEKDDVELSFDVIQSISESIRSSKPSSVGS